MSKSVVAVIKTKPATVLEDYHRADEPRPLPGGGGQDADTALKVNISWHFFYPASSTTPWQLDGVIKTMKRDG